MSIEINERAAHNILSVLAEAGWRSARRGLEILASQKGFTYRADPMSKRDAEGLYRLRATSLGEAGTTADDLDNFIEAIALSELPEVLIFSLSDDYSSCVCVTSPDLRDAIASVAIPIVRPGSHP